ncbi:hypothetical protein [Tenacibaculum amylolyticum]|uniref:hypothetical protein n=1 Tax=Tenacibaculum amylolyticum TaxID=104269 RepID=UPI003895C1A3
MKTLKTMLALLLAVSITSVSAQIGTNTREAVDNTKAMIANKQQLKKDVAQLHSFKKKIAAFEDAFISNDRKQIKRLKADILSDMKREIAQSERKIKQDQIELRQSKRELNNSRREARNSRRDVAWKNTRKNRRDLRDDKRDKRDDLRDKNDDVRDLKAQVARTARQKDIMKTIKAYNYLAKRKSGKHKLVTNSNLLNEFAKTMEADIKATKLEIAEDKREIREDRRERREDRRG